MRINYNASPAAVGQGLAPPSVGRAAGQPQAAGPGRPGPPRPRRPSQRRRLGAASDRDFPILDPFPASARFLFRGHKFRASGSPCRQHARFPPDPTQSDSDTRRLLPDLYCPVTSLCLTPHREGGDRAYFVCLCRAAAAAAGAMARNARGLVPIQLRVEPHEELEVTAVSPFIVGDPCQNTRSLGNQEKVCW